MRNLSIITILTVLVLSCDPCDDCTTVTFEPTAQMIFINADSVSSIDSSLVAFAEIDSSLNSNIDSLTVLRDSLQIITDSIANGGNLGIEQLALQTLISARQSDSIMFANQNVGLDSIGSVLSSTRATINSGLLLIRKIKFPEINDSLIYTDEDSATFWNFPLSYEGAFSSYEITIDNEVFSIELEYENFTEIDEERNVLIRAQDIQVINHSFDSLNSCETCVDGEATFTFYF